MLNRYEETQARLQKIRDPGYKVISIWGCEFSKHLCNNRDLKNELCSHRYMNLSPENIRDSLYGGWTGTTKTCYRVKQGEEIHYVNVIILCPNICKYSRFPVGHPKVNVGADCPSDCFDRGDKKYIFPPPRNVYHPVLPYKSNSRPKSPPCSACADTMN